MKKKKPTVAAASRARRPNRNKPLPRRRTVTESSSSYSEISYSSFSSESSRSASPEAGRRTNAQSMQAGVQNPGSSKMQGEVTDEHNYFTHLRVSTEWRIRVVRAEQKVQALRKDLSSLRKQLLNANKKTENLTKCLELEQRMHNETRQTLKVLMQGLRLESE